MTITKPKPTLHLEGLAMLLVAVIGYAQLDYAWWQFFLFLPLPDVAIAFYALNPQIGSIAYNLVHSYTLPLILLAVSLQMTQPMLMAAALIWLAHIGMDRMVGYGLKYPTDFKDTHFSHI